MVLASYVSSARVASEPGELPGLVAAYIAAEVADSESPEDAPTARASEAFLKVAEALTSELAAELRQAALVDPYGAVQCWQYPVYCDLCPWSQVAQVDPYGAPQDRMRCYLRYFLPCQRLA